MSGRSVNLTTLFLSWLRPHKLLTSTSCTYFPQQLTTALLEKAEGETKVCCQTGYRTQVPYRLRYAALPVCVVFCVYTYILIRRVPPLTFNDTAITGCHSDTTFSSSCAHWVRISWSTGSEKSFGHVLPAGSRTLDFLREQPKPYPLGQALCSLIFNLYKFIF